MPTPMLTVLRTVLRKPGAAGAGQYCEGSGVGSRPTGEMLLVLLDVVTLMVWLYHLCAQGGTTPAVQHLVLGQHKGVPC
jgi:hypothetical protein